MAHSQPPNSHRSKTLSQLAEIFDDDHESQKGTDRYGPEKTKKIQEFIKAKQSKIK